MQNEVYFTEVTWLKTIELSRLSETMCCSQGQNPKVKDEAKARTLKAEAKA